jgi:hypothetical protein
MPNALLFTISFKNANYSYEIIIPNVDYSYEIVIPKSITKCTGKKVRASSYLITFIEELVKILVEQRHSSAFYPRSVYYN